MNLVERAVGHALGPALMVALAAAGAGVELAREANRSSAAEATSTSSGCFIGVEDAANEHDANEPDSYEPDPRARAIEQAGWVIDRITTALRAGDEPVFCPYSDGVRWRATIAERYCTVFGIVDWYDADGTTGLGNTGSCIDHSRDPVAFSHGRLSPTPVSQPFALSRSQTGGTWQIDYPVSFRELPADGACAIQTVQRL